MLKSLRHQQTSPTPIGDRRSVTFVIVLFTLLFAFLGCATKKATDLTAVRPGPAVSQLLITESGGFVFTRGASGAFESCRYVIILNPAQPPKEKLYLRTRFENPANSSRPIELESEVTPGQEKIQLESPNVRGLRAGRNYKVEVVVFDTSDRSHAIGVHTQMVQAMVKF